MPASLSIFLRDDFTLTTWMLIGACIQSILFLVLPLYVAVLFTGIFSAARIVKFVLTSRKILVDPDLTHVRYGRYTAPIPSENGSLPLKASEAEVVVFILGARSNHPLGRFGPGFKDLGQYAQTMWQEAEKNPEKWGYLGKASTLLGTDSEAGNALIMISYWKDLASLQAFANGPTHRAGWDWWIGLGKKYPHIGIMHEVYAVPKHHWENIYVNFQPFGMGQTKHLTKDQGNEERSFKNSLIEAKEIKWRSMLSRMNRETNHD